MKFRIILSILMFYCALCNAQHDNVWIFGNKAGLDFNFNPPRPIVTPLSTNEGCAGLCDESGQLMFYTDGTTVYDRNNDTMPNGTDICKRGKNITNSTAQGALIVPMPGNAKKYYIFSLGQLDGNIPIDRDKDFGTLYYSIVDLNLNGGLGDVETANKGIFFDSLFIEQIVAVSGINCNVWLIASSRKGEGFRVYNIDANGINRTPIESPRYKGELNITDYLGNMALSSDGTRIALAKGNLTMYDFDVVTGKISNGLILDRRFYPEYYGAAFSPDNSKLYATSTDGVTQYDMLAGDSTAIVNSAVVLPNSIGLRWGIKLGPDGKVYAISANANAISIINKPNLKGAASDLVRSALSFAPQTSSILGMPNYTTIIKQRNLKHIIRDTAFCTKQQTLQPTAINGIGYVWDDGSTGATRTVTAAGTYWVAYQVTSPCILDNYVDTFKVVFDSSRRLFTTTTFDSVMCRTGILTIKPTNNNGTNYAWSDGALSIQRQVTTSGTYIVTYRIDSLCRDYVDSFVIAYPAKDYRASFSADSIVCEGDTLQVTNTSDAHYNNFTWTLGTENSSLRDPQFVLANGGQYIVKLVATIDGACADSISKTVIVDTITKNAITKNADNVCVGARILFSALPDDSKSYYLWDFGGGNITTSENVLQYSYDNAGTYYPQLTVTYRACPNQVYRDTITILPYPTVNIGPDTTLCPGQLLTLSNAVPLQAGNSQKWNTGETSSFITINAPGTYWLVAQNENGCSITDTVQVHNSCYVAIPNAFSPNGDGVNDYFFPRNILTEGVATFYMQIFSRWGMLLFETNSITGRGWDGSFNGVPQQEGVYIYKINVLYSNGRQEAYQGNITLIR